MSYSTVIVHGGAGTIQPYIWSRYLDGAHSAAVAAQHTLEAGGSALDAVTEACVIMEDDVTFNTSTGSALTLTGQVECDALVATDDLRSGAVAAVSGVRHPVLLARAVMEHTPHLLLAGPGAVDLARAHGIELCDPAEQVSARRLERYRQMRSEGAGFEGDPERDVDNPTAEEPADTVGACALDERGRLAVASSSGGIMLKHPGRVGDVPLLGSGNYCGPAGAVTCSGHGEVIMRLCLAKYAYDQLASGTPVEETIARTMAYLARSGEGRAGLLAIDARGNRGWATSTAHIAVGIPDGRPSDICGFLEAEGNR